MKKDETIVGEKDLRLPELEPPPFEQTRLKDLPAKTRPASALYAPRVRGLILLFAAVGAAAAGLLVTHVRRDLGTAPWLVTYGAALLELAAGALLFWLAMRWAVPGAGGSSSRSRAYLGAVLVLALVAAFAVPHLVTEDHPGLGVGIGGEKGLRCMGWQLMTAFPVLLLGLWMIFRGASVDSTLAGTLAGLGAGLLSDAAIHLHCGAVDPAHTVTWHLGAVVLLTLLGGLLGRLLRTRA
ncbi:MAG: NrsF family protein [bacterium]